MVRVAEGIADGDVEHEIADGGRDELGALARAFSRMIAYLRTAAGAAERIAHGDLSERIEPASERDALGNAFGRMTDDLRELVGEVAGSAGRLGSASREMAEASEGTGRAVDEIARDIVHVAEGAREQAAAVERSRDTTESIAGSSEESSRRAASTRAAVDEALAVARDGERALGAVEEVMTSVEDAGEPGRGFAVVADEVRSLADETDRAGAQIAELVERLQQEMHASVDPVRAIRPRACRLKLHHKT